MQENKQPVLDEEQDKPSSRITTEINIDVEEYFSSSKHSRSGTPDLDDESDTDDSSQPSDDNKGDNSRNAAQRGTKDLRRESQMPLSPFTREDELTYATQDEHHEARQPFVCRIIIKENFVKTQQKIQILGVVILRKVYS